MSRDPRPTRRRELDIPWWGGPTNGRPSAALFASPDRVLPGLLLGLLLALIVYIPNQAQFRLETGLRGVNVPNILFAMALAVMAAMRRPPSPPTPLKLPLVLFMLLLAFALLVALVGDATAWVEDVTVYKNAIFYLLLYFLYYHAVRDVRTLRILVLALMFVVFTSAVLGLRQALDYGIGNFNENKRVAAPFGWSVFDANRSAIYFCIFLQLLAAMALFLRGHLALRLACAGTFVLGVFVVFHTYSRQAYIILAVLLLLLALRKHLVIAALAGLALFHYQLWVPDTVVERIEMTQVDPFEVKTFRPEQPAFDSPSINGPLYGSLSEAQSTPFGILSSAGGDAHGEERQYDESTESRFTLWAGAWELIQQRPLGIGMNRFKREITPHVPTSLAGKDAHNFYVLLTTEAGLVAPLFLLSLMLSLLWLGHRLTRLSSDGQAVDGEGRALGIGFLMATLAVMFGNVYGSRFLDGDVMGSYWVLAGLVARAVVLKEQERRQRRQRAAGVGAPTPGGPLSGLSPRPVALGGAR